MEICYDGALVMPSNYAVMNEDEMMYTEGGLNISYKLSYATKAGATAKAASVIWNNRWSNISLYDMTAEIYCHAVAYYHGSVFLKICGALGYSTSKIKASGFWKSLKNGIDVANGKDTATICGVKRYVLFRAAYTYALTNSMIL